MKPILIIFICAGFAACILKAEKHTPKPSGQPITKDSIDFKAKIVPV